MEKIQEDNSGFQLKFFILISLAIVFAILGSLAISHIISRIFSLPEGIMLYLVFIVLVTIFTPVLLGALCFKFIFRRRVHRLADYYKEGIFILKCACIRDGYEMIVGRVNSKYAEKETDKNA
ncbi:MAG: hypothetical protein QS98_C0011G0104 [archaeon GW2011_AR3]|nr:MAG: hypothetical protein QS98_C0011G0104 [archaeon GW2011_AR3]